MDRKLIAVAVSSALALPMAAQAVEMSISGHVNRAMVILSQDGHARDGDLQFVDANSSESRFRFKGSEELDNGLTVGVTMEFGAGGDSSDGALDGGTHYNDGALGRPLNAIRKREQNVYVSSAAGKVTFGLSAVATDGMAHADLGGPSWLGGVTNWCSYGGTGPACPSNDGNRREVLRYDAPALGPVLVNTSFGNDGYWDAKATVAGSMGDSGYDLRVGYISESDPATTFDGLSDTLTVSGAFSVGSTSVAAAWSQVDSTDHEYLYLKVDQSYGDGSIGAYYKRGEMGAVEGSLWGMGVGHSVGGGATAYAGFRFIEADGDEDASLFVAGMRVTFN